MLRLPFFIMTLSGSLVVVLYGLFYPVIKRRVSLKWQRNILKAAIFFYLFPLPLFMLILYDHFPVLAPRIHVGEDFHGGVLPNLNYTIDLMPGRFYIGPNVLAVAALTCCMAIISLFILGKQIKQHLAVSRAYRSAAFSTRPIFPPREEFERTKEELGIKKKVQLISSSLCKTPMTIGVFSPTIVFPTEDGSYLEPSGYRYILKHELLHIKNGDTFTKLLLIIVLALHWYNPLCYFLYHEVSVVCEMICDREVIKSGDEAVRQEYSRLILELATKNSSKKEKFAIGFVRPSATDYERRILEMKAGRNGKLLLSCVMVFAVCLFGFITAFAYEPPRMMGRMIGLTGFKPGAESISEFSASPSETDLLPHGYFFEDEDGNIIPLDREADDDACDHDFVKGRISIHIKISDGSCLITAENALRCSVCGYLDHLDVFSKMTWFKCPHKG